MARKQHVIEACFTVKSKAKLYDRAMKAAQAIGISRGDAIDMLDFHGGIDSTACLQVIIEHAAYGIEGADFEGARRIPQ